MSPSSSWKESGAGFDIAVSFRGATNSAPVLSADEIADGPCSRCDGDRPRGNRRLRLGLAIFVTVVASVRQACAEDEKWVSVSLRPDVKPSTLKAIAEAAEPTSYTVRDGDTRQTVLRNVYGANYEKIEPIAAKQEPRLSKPLNPGEELKLPPAPRWGFEETRIVPKGGSVWAVAEEATGWAGDRTLQQIRDLNPQLHGDLEHVPSGTKIRVPFAEPTVTFRVKPAQSDKVLALVGTMMRDAAYKSHAVAEEAPARLIPSSDLATAAASCIHPCEPRWHIRSLTCEGCLGQRRIKEISIVGVLDSGVLYNDSRIMPALWVNPDPTAFAPTPAAKKLAETETNGRSYVTSAPGYPLDDCVAAGLSNHGTHVAGIIAGYGLSTAERKWLAKHVQLLIVKVADHSGAVDIGNIADGISYAQIHGARVINLSLVTRRSGDLEDCIRKRSDQLFVTAAGNRPEGDGTDLAITPVYPAAYSAAHANVISVAAVDSTYALACFSNYGRTMVDLAAPGVAIESLKAGGIQALSGTSQAAAMVSLAAALLDAEAKNLGPIRIRRRLMASSTYSSSLANVVRAAGVLDIPTALRLDEDLVQLRGEPTVMKTRFASNASIHLARGDIPLKEVDAVVVDADPAKPGVDRIGYYNPDSERIEYEDVQHTFETIEAIGTDGSRLVYTRAQVRKLIPRMRYQ